jgi:tRNA-2-methylthio-N6-dimethylallyladenosine synthase
MADQVPADVLRDRYDRLVTVVNDVAWAEGRALVGRTVELMVSEGEGRKDAATRRLSGRGPDNRLVHFAAPDAETTQVRPGDRATVEITHAAPHHLVADRVVATRRTRSGDAWEARTLAPAPSPAGVGLGMPTLGPPVSLPEAPGCP